jgi:hypothetical protein
MSKLGVALAILFIVGVNVLITGVLIVRLLKELVLLVVLEIALLFLVIILFPVTPGISLPEDRSFPTYDEASWYSEAVGSNLYCSANS